MGHTARHPGLEARRGHLLVYVADHLLEGVCHVGPAAEFGVDQGINPGLPRSRLFRREPKPLSHLVVSGRGGPSHHSLNATGLLNSEAPRSLEVTVGRRHRGRVRARVASVCWSLSADSPAIHRAVGGRMTKCRPSSSLLIATRSAPCRRFGDYEDNHGGDLEKAAGWQWESVVIYHGACATPTGVLLSAYFADAGKTGSLPTSRSSCWMTTVALRLAAIFLKRSREPTV
jgi:hypothetical protein